MAEREHRGDARRVVAAVADEQPFRVVDAAVAGDGVQDGAVGFAEGQRDGQPAPRLKTLGPPLLERDLLRPAVGSACVSFMIANDFLRYTHAIVRDHVHEAETPA
jgi:hypothetical protein